MKSFQIVRTALFVIVSSLFISCEDNTGEGLELSFDMNLPKDKNGYYHLTLDNNNWQTLHRVSATIRDKELGHENFWIEWDSDLYWYLGDTLGYIINREFSLYSGQYVSVDTTYMIGFNRRVVPTSNAVSYSNAFGEINNMIAPVKSMKGDTLTLIASWYDGSAKFSIVLD